MCDPGNAADLRGSALVLGSFARKSAGYSIGRRKSELLPKDYRTRRHHHRMSDVDRWRCIVRRSAHILPPGAGQYTIILFVLIQTEDNHSKLLPPPQSTVILAVVGKANSSSSQWFFVVVLIQNYFLSAPYGRNWLYLWSSQAVPAWLIVILIIFFFGGIWIAFLYIFSHMSKSHSWVLPIFAMGLGAPRWAQILWSTSNMGQYLPWTVGPMASGVAGRSLWLWLGVLDAVQGVGKSLHQLSLTTSFTHLVYIRMPIITQLTHTSITSGFGMILLQTLTRFHVLFTLIAAQMLGSLATIVGRATAPDKIGPGKVFPNFCIDPREGLSSAWFWVTLLSQLAVPIGFGAFFRKEQLSKA